MARKLYYFAVCCAYIVGAVGGLCALLYHHEIVTAVCNGCVSAMAFPYVRYCLGKLTE